MGRKWQKNTKQGGGKGGKGQPQKKRRRGSDSDSSDDERGQKRAKAAKNNANAKKISEQGNSSFLTHASQMSDQIAKIPKEDLEGLPSFQRNFWTGPVPEADGMDSLKATRKSLGILVKGPGSDMCPPPISTVTDAGIPTSFAAAFTKLRLSVPTLVQMQSWPSMLAGNNLLCIAPTGSGKTLAYGLPLLPHITHQKNSKSAARGGTFPVRPSGLVLVPTRELALQVAADFKALKALASIKVVAVYGGQDKDAQLETLVGVEGASPADVIVATPGRLIDLMSTKHISLSSVTYLVLDEADRMLALGFEEQLNALSDHIRPDKQAALFSATFPGRLRNACDKWIGEAVTLRVSTMEISNDYLVDRENKKNDAAATATATSKAVSSAETQEGATLATESATTASAGLDDSAIEGLSSSLTLSKTVTQEVHVCVPHKKPRLLIRYILRVREKEKVEKMRQPGPMIIFCAKIKTISYLIKFVTQQGLIAEKFHGQLAQSAREKVLNDFKAGKINILIATDVAARGIHIKRLKYVVNYDFPNNLEQYCHRVGRAGRQGEIGYSYSFLTRNAAVIAKDLIALLRACDQSIEPNLLQLDEDYRNGVLPISPDQENENSGGEDNDAASEGGEEDDSEGEEGDVQEEDA